MKNYISSVTLLYLLTISGGCAEFQAPTISLGSASSTPLISFDMPHGGCRLSVNSDGSGTLGYGALPTLIRIKKGTFDAESLVRDLRAIAVPQTDDINTRLPGSIKFGREETLLWFSDKELAQINFQKALRNAEPPERIVPNQQHRVAMVENTCQNL